ncbi:MAG: hypothetical protein Kow0069_08540 [Promethearchaeota archaeon]
MEDVHVEAGDHAEQPAKPTPKRGLGKATSPNERENPAEVWIAAILVANRSKRSKREGIRGQTRATAPSSTARRSSPRKRAADALPGPVPKATTLNRRGSSLQAVFLAFLLRRTSVPKPAYYLGVATGLLSLVLMGAAAAAFTPYAEEFVDWDFAEAFYAGVVGGTLELVLSGLALTRLLE